MVLITIDGKVTQSLQSGVWSEDFVLPFEPAYNTTWIGRISDYVDHLIRFQIMYPCK